jgi:uncharacterized coiled-coil protein SlyX
MAVAGPFCTSTRPPPGVPRNDPDRDSIDRRLAAVERALAEDQPLERTDRLDDLEGRVAELEAAVQALRGYVGSVRAVNEEVERRADRAFRKARAVERSVSPDPRNPAEEGNESRDEEPDAGRALARLRRRL